LNKPLKALFVGFFGHFWGFEMWLGWVFLQPLYLGTHLTQQMKMWAASKNSEK
jgi:hypothetical protein